MTSVLKRTGSFITDAMPWASVLSTHVILSICIQYRARS